MEVRLRAGEPEDAVACGDVCYEAFRSIAERHGFAPDIPSAEIAVKKFTRWLSHPGFHVFVAEAERRIVASTVLDERSTVVGLGPITVDPAVQDQSVGRRLVETAIERVTERMFVGCIKCSCDPTEVRLFVGRSKGDGSRTIHLPPVIYCAEHGVAFLRRLRKHEPDDMGYLKKMDEAIRLLEKAAHERAVQENAAD